MDTISPVEQPNCTARKSGPISDSACPPMRMHRLSRHGLSRIYRWAHTRRALSLRHYTNGTTNNTSNCLPWADSNGLSTPLPVAERPNFSSSCLHLLYASFLTPVA